MQQFENLRASSLYCQKCQAAMPVRERLLLVLPGEGNLRLPLHRLRSLARPAGGGLGEKNLQNQLAARARRKPAARQLFLP